jgi:hypothetical protein
MAKESKENKKELIQGKFYFTKTLKKKMTTHLQRSTKTKMKIPSLSKKTNLSIEFLNTEENFQTTRTNKYKQIL